MVNLTIVQAVAILINYLEPLYPEFNENNNGWLSPTERLALAKHILKIGDLNGDGHLDYGECYRFLRQNYAKVQEARKTRLETWQREEEQAKHQQETEWLKKYDFNGNGKLDPEERARAEKDHKAGIEVPAMQDE